MIIAIISSHAQEGLSRQSKQSFNDKIVLLISMVSMTLAEKLAELFLPWQGSWLKLFRQKNIGEISEG